MSDLIQTHETRHVDDLQAHEFNREIYNTNATDLIDRIEEQGYEDTFGRITIKPDGTILSGHRRWKAAQAAGIEELPVEVVEPDGEFEERRLILLANEYRDKTPAEKIREGEAWEEIESEKAKERMSRGGGDESGKENLPDPESGQSRDKAAEKVGVSGRTYEKGKKVKEKADEGDEKAQEEWEKLESGEQSIHGAHKEVKKNENTTDDKPEKKDPREQHTELSLVRVLEDGACIYTSGGDTYLVPKDQLPE
jgi:ParB family chromosome partitioning protein